MALDTSIYGMVRGPQAAPSPLDDFAKVMSIKGLIDQQGLTALQRQQLERGIADEDATRAAYQSAGGDQSKVMQLLYGQGLYKPAMAVEKALGEKKKSDADLQKTQMETLVKATGVLKDRLPTVRDEVSYRAYVDTAKQMLGPDMVQRLNLPPSFDPQWVRNQMVKAEELFTPKMERVDIGGSIQTVDMNPFTNPAIASTKFEKTMTPGDRASNSVAWYNATKPQFNESVGGFISPPTRGNPNGSVIPLTMPNGSPLPNPKAREDIDSLRKEFNSLPEVKNYRDVVPIINAAIKAPNTPAGDFALIYGVGKILDPGSVVREGEMNMVIKSGSPAERVNSYLTYLKGEGRITPQMRSELNQMLSGRVSEMRSSYDSAKGSYEGIAKKRGYDSADIFATVPEVEKISTGAPQESRVKSLPDPAKHKDYTATDPQSGITYKSDGKKWVKVNG